MTPHPPPCPSPHSLNPIFIMNTPAVLEKTFNHRGTTPRRNPWFLCTLLCVSASRWFTALPVSAAATPPKAPTEEEILQLDPFEITGTLIKRAEAEGPAPVVMITREEIEFSGRASFSEMMSDLPEAAHNSINDSATMVSPQTIRGAAPLGLRGTGTNTLVLVDGRRAVATGTTYSRAQSFVDMNRFPTAMIQRVEILEDCGAIYGSDTVSGVINIILRKDYNGAEVTARYGNSFRTDVGEKSLSILAGTSNQKSHLTVGFSYDARGALRATDTTFADNADVTGRYWAKSPVYANRTFDLRSSNGPQAQVIPVSGQRNNVLGVNIPGLTATALISSLPGTGGIAVGRLASATPSFSAPLIVGTGGQFDAAAAATFVAPITAAHSNPSNRYNTQELAWLTPRVERTGGNASLRHFLSPHATAYGRFAYQHNRSHIEYAPIQISYLNDHNIFVPRTNYWNPFGVDVWFVYRPVEIGARTFDTITDSVGGVVGVRGMIAGRWVWDTGCSVGLDEVHETLGNQISESRLRASLAKSTPDAFNIFGGARFKNDLATLDSFRVSTWLRGRSSLETWDARVSGEAFVLPAGPVGVGFYAEVNRQKYSQVNNPFGAAQDDLINLPRTSDPTWARRTAEAAVAEMHLPLVKRGEHRWLYNSDLATAVRFDNYSDGYNSGFKPYFGLRVQPLPRLTLRASYARSFGAPSLQRLYAGAVETYAVGLQDLRRPPVLTGDPWDGANTSRLVRDQGNPHLQPSHSTAKQIGLVCDVPGRLLKGLTIGATWYRLEVLGIAVPPSNAAETLSDELGLFGDAVVRELGTEAYTNKTNAPINILSGPNGAMTSVAPGQVVTVPGRIRYLDYTFVNYRGGGYVTEGWDFKLAYARSLEPFGRVRIGSSLAYMAFHGEGTPPILDMNRVGRDYLPRVRMQSSLLWTRASWHVGLTHNYIGPFGDLTRGYRVEVDPHSIYGVTVSRSFNREAGGWLRGTRLMLGVDNLFDREPSLYYDTTLASVYVPGFARRPAGRFFYAEVKKTF